MVINYINKPFDQVIDIDDRQDSTMYGMVNVSI